MQGWYFNGLETQLLIKVWGLTVSVRYGSHVQIDYVNYWFSK